MSQQKHFARYTAFVALLLLTFVLLSLVFSRNPAYGHLVYQGADITNTFNYDKGLYTCDREYDGNGVRGDAWAFDQFIGSVYDTDGANNQSCGQGISNRKVASHRTCELDGGWAPTCTSYISEPW